MSSENVLKFNDIVKKDKTLQQRLMSASDESEFLNLYVDLAREKGIQIPRGELQGAVDGFKKKKHEMELSEKELDAIAHGCFYFSTIYCGT